MDLGIANWGWSNLKIIKRLMTIFDKIVKHCAEQNYVKIKRNVGNKSYELRMDT